MARVHAFKRSKAKAVVFRMFLALVVAGLLLTSKPAQADTITGNDAASLQEAIDQAKNNPGPDFIEITQEQWIGAYNTGTYDAIQINDPSPLTINGNGAKIEQYGTGPVFWIQAGGSVVINELEIATIATGTLGGVQSSIEIDPQASLYLTNSTVHHNTNPAAIFNSGYMVMGNSTVSGNTGAGIQNEGSLDIYSSTITDNGIGISNNGTGRLSLYRTIVAANSGIDVDGPISGCGFNLLGVGDGSTGLTDGVCYDRVGTTADPVDPGLRPLGFSDPGPDIPLPPPSTPIHPLRINSPAVDAIDASQCPLYLAIPPYSEVQPFNTDQRGAARPWGPACDIGAFEREPRPVQAAVDAYTTDEGTPLTVGAPGALGNDNNWGSPIVVAEPRPVSGPSNGTLVLNANGAFTYTPDEGFTGTDSFTYTASHGGLLTSDPTTVTITVTPKNTSPFSYDFHGFFKPVDNPDVATNKVKAGSAIPVKFSLGGNMGLDIFEEGYPKSELITDPKVEVDGVEQTVTASSSGLSYDPTTGVYTYVWKTDKGWANSYRQLVLKFDDGTTVKRANFNFTR